MYQEYLVKQASEKLKTLKSSLYAAVVKRHFLLKAKIKYAGEVSYPGIL